MNCWQECLSFNSCLVAGREPGLFWDEPSEYPLEVLYEVLALPPDEDMKASCVGGCKELLG